MIKAKALSSFFPKYRHPKTNEPQTGPQETQNDSRPAHVPTEDRPENHSIANQQDGHSDKVLGTDRLKKGPKPTNKSEGEKITVMISIGEKTERPLYPLD